MKTALRGPSAGYPAAKVNWSIAQHPACRKYLFLPLYLEKRETQSRTCPTRSWKAIAGKYNLLCLASHKLQKALEQHLPALPGQVPSCRRAQAEQEPRTGELEDLPCLPVQRDGFAERGGLQQTTGSSVCKEIREGIYQAITTRSCEYSICDG